MIKTMESHRVCRENAVASVPFTMPGGAVQKQQAGVCLKSREGFGDRQVVIKFQSLKTHVAKGLREGMKAGRNCLRGMLAAGGRFGQ
jgi:hypothetical protein